MSKHKDRCDACSRRDFLRFSAAALGAGAVLPLFLQETNLAFAANALAGVEQKHPERILVVLEMTGGNDGLNARPASARSRRTRIIGGLTPNWWTTFSDRRCRTFWPERGFSRALLKSTHYDVFAVGLWPRRRASRYAAGGLPGMHHPTGPTASRSTLTSMRLKWRNCRPDCAIRCGCDWPGCRPNRAACC